MKTLLRRLSQLQGKFEYAVATGNRRLAGKTVCDIIALENKIENMNIIKEKTPLEIATDAARVHCGNEIIELFSSFEDRVFWFAKTIQYY